VSAAQAWGATNRGLGDTRSVPWQNGGRSTGWRLSGIGMRRANGTTTSCRACFGRSGHLHLNYDVA